MSENEQVISIKGLRKSYGRFEALHGIDIEVRKGEIFGFLGPNGAGKTTTIRTLLDFIRPTGGSIKVFGLDSVKGSREIHRRVGYLPGEIGYYMNLRGREFLAYMRELQGGTDESIDEIVDALKLDVHKRIGDYSKGNRQKLSLVQAFMHDPELYILDEPTIGLDPLMQQEVYKLLVKERERGKTIFISSHLLAEVERVCDRVCIIKEGEIIALESVRTLKDRMGKVMEVSFTDDVSIEELSVEGVKSIQKDGDVFKMVITGNVDNVIKRIADHQVANMNFQSFSLEHLFLEYYGNGQLPEEGGEA